MLVAAKPKTRLARFKHRLIAATFHTLNGRNYAHWRPDQWYIARKKDVFDYFSWKALREHNHFWVWVSWMMTWMLDISAAYNAAANSSMVAAYAWLIAGQAYCISALLLGAAHCMKVRYNSIVYERLLHILPFDTKSAYNGREYSYKNLTGEGFDSILHSEIANCTNGRCNDMGFFYYDADRDFFHDFADIADSLTASATNEEDKLP